jgi:hypothetical protein
MTFPSKFLAAALMAGSLPVLAGPATAAPLAQPLGLTNAQTSTVEQVQWRRGHRGYWRGGRWIGPAAGFAAGVAVGSALAAPNYYDGYYAYGAAPGYVPVAPRSYYGYRNCGGTEGFASAYPNWACDSNGEAANFYR